MLVGVSRGAVTEIVEALLARCVHENNPDVRILLAQCFGEVGAISEHRLEELKPAVDFASGEGVYNLTKPPWRSRPARYELQLVTTHLVIALKAAATASDQHKIAFTIQELLSNLDNSANEGSALPAIEIPEGSKVAPGKANDLAGPVNRKTMSDWLAARLREVNVYEIVEPYWFTEFHEVILLCTCFFKFSS
jgi:hypothetical protein